MQQDAILPGETVWLRQQRWRVERTRADRDVVRLDLSNRSGRRTFWLPFDRVDRQAARVRFKYRQPRAAAARLAALVARAGQARTLPVLVDAKLDILPYQIEPALAIFAGARRVLLADEVGLGKTLQAAIVAAELVRREPAARILIVVPASIVSQWSDELQTRFDLSCRIADRGGLDVAGRETAVGGIAWRRSGIWIATLDFLKQPHVLQGLPADPWDLVVVDEAHGACGRTERHAAADALLRSARRCLLLTATPHSGDEERYTRLLQIGAVPGLPDPLTIFRRTRADAGSPCSRRVRWLRVPLSTREIATLDALADFERAIARAAGPARMAGATLLLSVFRKRALSTMTALAVSLERRAAWLDRDVTPAADDWRQPVLAFDGDDDDDETRALAAVSGLDVTVERRWLKRLIALARAAKATESKLGWIARLLSRSVEPVILFTEFRHSLDAARARLARRRTVVTVHGGQRDAERQAELAAFLDGRASVLIATDVAGQGLNLQHRARWVINLELPWNPVRLEQRAGRVDRIGQRRPVHITSLVARHGAETGLLTRLARRVLAARRALDGGTLPIAPPAAIAEAEIAGALLFDQPLPEPAVPQAPLCTRWRRHGRWLARTVTRRRCLAAVWRGPVPGVTPATLADIARLPSLARFAPCWVVFVVPIVDDAGAILESRVIAVESQRDSRSDAQSASRPDARSGSRSEGRSASRRAHGDSAMLAAAALQAARVANVRARRLARAQSSAAKIAIAIERAIEATAAASAPAAPLQPGLFDRRAERRAGVVAERREAASAATARRLEDIDQSTRIRAGTPALVALLRRR